jgi:hypothetical protein
VGIVRLRTKATELVSYMLNIILSLTETRLSVSLLSPRYLVYRESNLRIIGEGSSGKDLEGNGHR